MRRFKLVFSIVLGVMISFSAVCSVYGITKKEINRIAADFSLAAYPENNDFRKQLNKDGWKLQIRSFDKSKNEILEEILANPRFSVNLQALQSGSDLDYDALKKYIESLKCEGKPDNAVDKYLELFSDQNDLVQCVDWRIKQKYGYTIGNKNISGRNVYVLAYKGTEGPEDWWTWIFTNGFAFRTEFLSTGTHVHIGFEWYRQECWEDENVLAELIENIAEDDNSILIITGHSMGGAAAVLQSAYIMENKLLPSDKLELVTFAEPCPGAPDFKEYYNNTIKNYNYYVNLFDLVPLLPVAVGYEHFGKLYAFSVGGGPLDRHNVHHYRDYVYSINDWK